MITKTRSGQAWSTDPFDGLGPLLELISGPAFVVDSQGRVLLANEAGYSAIERDPSVRPDIVEATQGRPSARIESIRPLGRGVSTRRFIVRLTNGPPDLELRLPSAIEHAGLSEAESKVFRHLVAGDANKDVAAKLDCSVRTVEVHVTSILAKQKVDSRSRLIAWFWTR